MKLIICIKFKRDNLTFNELSNVQNQSGFYVINAVISHAPLEWKFSFFLVNHFYGRTCVDKWSF